MIIDLKKLKRSGKEQSDFFFLYEPQENLIELPDAKVVNPVRVNGTIFLTGEHSAFVEGQVNFVIQGNCTRCLSATEKEYLLDFEENVEHDNPDGYELKNDMVDLSKIVDDLIMINSPVAFLCKDDCKGICFNCGENLNESQCKCKNK